MTPDKEALTRALSDEARFLRESAVQSAIHNPKDPAPHIAALAAARTLEGISGALRNVTESPTAVPTEDQIRKVIFETGLHEKIPQVLYQKEKDGIEVDLVSPYLVSFVKRLWQT